MIVNDHVQETFRKSVSAAKWDVVARDIHLREVMDQMSRLECDLSAVDSYAVLTIKACGILSRKGSKIANWLRTNGFEIIDGWVARLSPERSRILWRWQLEKATRQRLWVMDNILAAADTVVLILRRDSRGDLPAATWLSTNKGPANRDRQRPGQLRFMLEPTCFLLNFVHTSDDVVDIFRDVYVLGGMRRVVTLCRAIGNGATAHRSAGDTWRLITTAEASAPFHDLSFGASVRGLARHIPTIGLHDAPLDLIDRLITDELAGRPAESRKLAEYAPIDVAVYVAHRFDMSLPQIRDPFASGSGTT